MAIYRVGIIGCGRPRNTAGATGYGMSHAHAEGYKASPDCEIVALADISTPNSQVFAEEHAPGAALYTDYREMLAQAQPDIVSISTWPALHCEMVVAAAEAGARAIHCEKPMAPTFGESLTMVETCEARGCQLTFNHQRRFGEPFRRAKEMLLAGAIGAPQRLEGYCGNLYDWGTHWFDMLLNYAQQEPVQWVMGQVDRRGEQVIFGVPVEGQGLSLFRFVNEVDGLLVTGQGRGRPGLRLCGSEGTIEVGVSEGCHLRWWGRNTGGWQDVPCTEGLHSTEFVKRGVLDLVDALKTGREPELSGRRALQATELIFATYESSRRRARVDLPLDITDSPYLAMGSAATAEAPAP